ncbi:MAG: hypothetical protein ACMVY4_12555 [Minwuia sp.]|uniref:hypothetical protein n=1 Tax=Minwuia sp. TaxID=2493630 RepID=UPI003A836418
MSEEGRLIAGVVFLLCLLVLVVPGYLSRQTSFRTGLRYAAIWVGIGAGIALAYDLWKG